MSKVISHFINNGDGKFLIFDGSDEKWRLVGINYSDNSEKYRLDGRYYGPGMVNMQAIEEEIIYMKGCSLKGSSCVVRKDESHEKYREYFLELFIKD